MELVGNVLDVRECSLKIVKNGGEVVKVTDDELGKKRIRQEIARILRPNVISPFAIGLLAVNVGSETATVLKWDSSTELVKLRNIDQDLLDAHVVQFLELDECPRGVGKMIMAQDRRLQRLTIGNFNLPATENYTDFKAVSQMCEDEETSKKVTKWLNDNFPLQDEIDSRQAIFGYMFLSMVSMDCLKLVK
jgi:hypothetical protein